MSDTHTPTPWQVARDFHRRNCAIKAGSSDVAHCYLRPGGEGRPGRGFNNADAIIEDCANAAFIVRAVNHHDDLVEALKVYADPGHWQDMTGEFLVHETDDDDRIVWDSGQIARAALEKIRAAQ